MTQQLTYMYLLTPLHTGASADEGNLMGIAREVHTEFPYLPASSLRGKIRAELEASHGEEEAGIFFGQKIKDGQQPTEGEVWFADATLLFFPIASLSHHLIWITCPLFLERWNRWLDQNPLSHFIAQCRSKITDNTPALVSFDTNELLLQNAKLSRNHLNHQPVTEIANNLKHLPSQNGMISQILDNLVIVSDEDCISLIETGLQREVRVTLEEREKTVKDGSFRSEEAIPPEAVLFFPWGMKPAKDEANTNNIRTATQQLLDDKLQFGGLEGLGRGWAYLNTVND
ncbi:type III-B CRISPR module RAMP protein Cmr4 (plasmid) [Euhalothece natronophila Z-M001]|uniref:Type III-B CRISPR module RAMP protein Cmr4 n=1 Tax=Euhalothece natronophila Z-M001 TaxID=522448 RepID=A0A5B8NSW8_9CHRO|nr:type III-B CRISPR module RAMP protein Cmr4 [Euhalothece natronophila]QDZ41601.1 type III-B CRISPR module RAMP protein Cmr4 [Euhalothece natronophila Z-M001]